MSEAPSGDGVGKIEVWGPEGSSVTICRHGGHVISWVSDGEELLFVSRDAVFKPPKAIRGGIPVCFPQFGTLGPLGQHGFARNSQFEVVDKGHGKLSLQLEPSEADLEKFPHKFRLTITVQVKAASMSQLLTVKNTGDSAFDFTTALHTYLNVSAIDQVKVHGLKGLEYYDNVDGKDDKKEVQEDVTVSGETDRIYKQAPDSSISVDDAGNARRISLRKDNFPDVVLWNPWIEKAKGMSDFGDDEYKAMICLEPALAKSGPVTLKPGHSWSASQELHVSKL